LWYLLSPPKDVLERRKEQRFQERKKETTTVKGKKGDKRLLKRIMGISIMLFQRKRKKIAYGNCCFSQLRLNQYRET
jgi:hypothetical protein